MPKKTEPGHANKGKPSKQQRPQKSGREERPDKVKNHQQHGREKKMDKDNQGLAEDIKHISGGAKPRNGCFPKLFMLLLPFMVFGAYLFLRS